MAWAAAFMFLPRRRPKVLKFGLTFFLMTPLVSVMYSIPLDVHFCEDEVFHAFHVLDETFVQHGQHHIFAAAAAPVCFLFCGAKG